MGVAVLPPSLIPALQKIAILGLKQAWGKDKLASVYIAGAKFALPGSDRIKVSEYLGVIRGHTGLPCGYIPGDYTIREGSG